jgi:asparagine synthase (glutamine-hydrolysing)
MCGLTGYWQPRGESESILYLQVEQMADTLTHRGPDDSGVWVDPAAGIAFGFRRLSILDLSPTGHQPMISSDQRYVIVFNGEIYNYLELRKELEQLGRHFRGSSDTEVILEACSAWGIAAAIPRLWGMFAIALWDKHEKTLVLARDRLGKKPLYYGQMGRVFMFGSELKALRAHPDFRSEIDRDALTLYLRHGYVPAPHSIYKNVKKLPQGYLAILRPEGSLILKPYWEARQVIECGLADPLKLSDAEAVDELEVHLRDATARRMIADVPLGALLSGGVDSSTVVALMQAQSTRPVKTFTVGFYEDGYNEAEMAKEVADHLGTDHTELYVTSKEAQAVIPRLPYLYDEPFADSSQIPTFLVCELTKQYVTVGLSGDGGDELFGGYNRYLWAESIWHWLRHVPTQARRCIAGLIQTIPPTKWDSVYGALEPLIPSRLRQRLPGDKLYKLSELLAVSHEDALYHRVVSQWKNPENVVVGGKEPSNLLLDPTLRSDVPNFTERMMYLDLMTYLPDDILVKVDRASMGVSLEARNPLLDHRVVEWIWRLPLSFKRRKGQSKWLLRQVLYRFVPPHLIERPKMGFGVPIDSWLRGPLREWAETLLNEKRLRNEGYFLPEPIRKAWNEHLSGYRNDQYRLWVILMFQAWKEVWSA